MTTEIDAAQVLRSYSSTLLEASEEPVRNLEELPYPKEVIKMVLMHCLTLTKPGNDRDFLRKAYVGLADFQSLSESERSSLRNWATVLEQSNRGVTTNEQLVDAAKSLADSGELAAAVHKRIATEAAVLREELKSAGF
jgi:hypothetical protein